MLKAVAGMGYASVELAHSFYGHDAAAWRKLLDKNGLQSCGMHMSLKALEGDAFDKTVTDHKIIATPYLIIASLPKKSLASVEAITESLHYELGHFGIGVTVVEPGGIATEFGANERHSGESEPPYDELRRQWDAASANLTGDDPPGPEIVARAIADVIEADEPPLRVPVGDDAEMIVAVRTSSDDATFEATVRETLGLTW